MGAERGGAFVVERWTGSASDFHSREIDGVDRRTCWVFEVDRPALVLGSSQALDVVDVDECRRRGVEVVRRRSGGGAVLLTPGSTAWVDLVVPVGDPLWDDDVARAMSWVGDRWRAALAACGVRDLEVHAGALVTTAWSRLVCLAGVGAGEVVGPRGKLVGISQRRTRSAARFQSAAERTVDLTTLCALLRPPRPSPGDLEPSVSGTGVAPGRMLDAFVRTLDDLA